MRPKKDKYGVLAVLWLLVSEILECMSEQNLLRSASWKYRKQKCFLNFFFKHEKTHVIPGLSFQVPQEKVIGWLFLVSTASAHVIAMIVMKQFQRRSDWMIGFGKYNKCKRLRWLLSTPTSSTQLLVFPRSQWRAKRLSKHQLRANQNTSFVWEKKPVCF